MTLHPLFASLFGGWKILFILAIIALPVLMIIVAGTIIYFLVRHRPPTPPRPPVTPTPPPVETHQAAQGACPHCGKPVPSTALGGICPECMLKAGLASQTEGPGAAGPQGTKITQPPLTPEEIAALFPQLEILECLGRGGMGVVYKARQPRLNRLVALKILAREKEQDSQFAERFTREAQALARLNHPNIVTVHDFGEAGGQCYLVMEYVDGLNLRQLLLAGKMPSEQALTIVPKICEALQYAHEQGIVHRDIKPENILLDKSGRVKIADFGIAKILGVEDGRQALTGAKDVMGTPHYMAPEQLEKPLTVDHRADIYSLGVVFYEMLTGELPLGKFAPPSKKVQLDVRLDEVVLHTLEKEPERRYQQASQLKTDVETISGTAHPTAEWFAAKVPPVPTSAVPAGKAASDKIILPTFLLAFFFGLFGAHRFYVGRIWTGAVQLGAVGGCILMIIACATTGAEFQPALGILLGFSICGCSIWATIDWILILCKAFTDGHGRRMTHWLHSQAGEMKTFVAPLTGSPSTPPPGGAAAPTAAPPPAALTAEKTPAAGTGKIVVPAVGLMVAGMLKLFSALTAMFVLAGPGASWLEKLLADHGVNSLSHLGALPAFVVLLLKGIPACFILFGGLQMMQLRSYAWAVAASILAIVSCSLVGFPVGIWALIVLAQPGVREMFADAAAAQSSKPGRLWPWILGGIAILGLIVFASLIALAFVPRTTAWNRDLNVRGTVTDAVTGRPIAGAHVVARYNRWGTGFPAASPLQECRTDRQGHFKLVTWKGFQTLGADAPGYETNRTDGFPAARAGAVKFDFQLQPQPAIVGAAASADPWQTAVNHPSVQADTRMTNVALTNDGAIRTLNLSSQNGRVVIETTNGKLSADQVQLRVNTDGTTSLTGQTINYEASPATNPPVLAQSTFTSTDDAETIIRSFTVEPGGRLSVDTDRGDIQVVTSDRNTVEVTVKREVSHASESEISQILKNHQVTLVQNGNEIQVRARSPKTTQSLLSVLGLKPSLNVSLKLIVPKQFNVNLNTAGGDVSVEDVEGKIDVGTSGGDLNLSKLRGPVQAHTAGGDILAADCTGNLQIRTSGGDVQIDRFAGSMFRAETSGGDVSLDLAGQVQMNCLLRTSGGSVTARLPESIAVYLDASTSGGEITAAIPVQIEGKPAKNVLRGTINGGGPVLSLQTSGGNIQVLKR